MERHSAVEKIALGCWGSRIALHDSIAIDVQYEINFRQAVRAKGLN